VLAVVEEVEVMVLILIPEDQEEPEEVLPPLIMLKSVPPVNYLWVMVLLMGLMAEAEAVDKLVPESEDPVVKLQEEAVRPEEVLSISALQPLPVPLALSLPEAELVVQVQMA
jgi:hypothetical protein